MHLLEGPRPSTPFALGGPPSHPTSPRNSTRFLLAAAASIMGTKIALSCIAARPARSPSVRSTFRPVTRAGPSDPSIRDHAC